MKQSLDFKILSQPTETTCGPAGHFVVLSGYNREEKTVMVADPFHPNPYSESHHYTTSITRVLCSILLGVLTYDANLLIIEPKRMKQET
ncbi:MAG: hypothetical protein HY809_08200 [Nitrospirae bacterium]|nr:hypothetical protein [Nitrospirota bacterium]